jgi:hemerythrin
MEDMCINKWNNSYSVGINIIDEQHRELFSMINSFYVGCFREDEKSARNFFEQSVHDMVNYIKHHFSTEEKLLEFTGYPGSAGHKQQHTEFLRNIMSQIRALETENTFPFRPYVQYVKDWLFTHITVSDKKFGVFLQDLRKPQREKKLLQKTD